MDSMSTWTCHCCGNVGFMDGNDGFYYCESCGAQSEDIIETGVDAGDFIGKGDDAGTIYSARYRRSRPIMETPISQVKPQTEFWSQLNLEGDDGIGPSGPSDFGSCSQSGLSYEDYYNDVRKTYVMGVQLMIQFQCEALVEKFKVTPLICGLAGPIWLRFVASTGVFHDDWADEAIHESEIQKEVTEYVKPRAKYGNEPHNLHGQRAVMIWYRALRKKIPLASSLAVSYLVCHVAREAVLPTDIVKWSVEGTLPYFAAFVEIEKQLGHSGDFPLGFSVMFRPSQAVPLQKLESMAASIAQSIGLDLPPVNFNAIASRYLAQLSLPGDKILSHACRIQEWSTPPELWLSSNNLRLPTRVCVVSILIVAIRILYNIHGFGAWEQSLCSSQKRDAEQGSDSPRQINTYTESEEKASQVLKSYSDAGELLHILEARYNELRLETPDYSKDLPTYLQYCKDVVFAGMEPLVEDHEEKNLIDQLWNFYQNNKDHDPVKDDEEHYDSVEKQKRLRDDEKFLNLSEDNKKIKEEGCLSSADDDNAYQGDGSLVSNSQPSEEILKDEAIRRLQLDMEENRFCYIPPRAKVKKFEYLHYVRKRGEGAFTYVAHADYYILLRAFARVAEVDMRIMHMGVLSFERRLAWLEKRIDHCLHLRIPSVSCEHCSDPVTHMADDPTDPQI